MYVITQQKCNINSISNLIENKNKYIIAIYKHNSNEIGYELQ